ncbi:spermidine/putrescine ABC transporter permease PotC [candidate division KSB3 bacterium]|uniref:Spermidine/putrescine ABC transporter permease PotC n=1 Tax=candidate division KSB3 bacterium TaxID=2044937 RepID=A0A2G6E581_9BACT|nr:MAG: spermidine/putrescine ABC transporter permease PotC [candidate division KSB3 bacterium]PIE29773.1 MAG: spermidine/putrescine ABC transporter permease PotC [candidate division KSB3 bacterium]
MADFSVKNGQRKGLLTWAVVMYSFFYLPILTLIVFSFNASRGGVVWRGFSLEWYARLFQDASLGIALKNSLIVAFATTLVSTGIGTMAALAMHKYHFRGKMLWTGIIYIPVIIPEIVVGVSLLSFFALLKITLGFGTITVAHIAFCLSYVIIVVQTRLHGLDLSLEEASMDLGAGRYKTFFYVTLPVIAPGIISSALLCFTLSIDDFVITFFTQGPNSTTLPVKIYSMVKFGVSPVVNAISTLFLLVTAVTVILISRLEKEA